MARPPRYSAWGPRFSRYPRSCCVIARPPSRSDCSSKITLLPFPANAFAVVSPAIPPPTTVYDSISPPSLGRGGGANCDSLELSGDELAEVAMRHAEARLVPFAEVVALVGGRVERIFVLGGRCALVASVHEGGDEGAPVARSRA